jgi:hypothetical protein
VEKTSFFSDNALRWIECILSERFGNSWEIHQSVSGISLQLKGNTGSIIFDTQQECFINQSAELPFTQYTDAEEEGWEQVFAGPIPAPGVEVLPSPLIEQREDAYIIHYDILGLTYFMFNRVEEIGSKELDKHKRFPAYASHAFRYGYLERPIVDEWMYILGQVIKKTWPNIELKHHHFTMEVSHDVDIPSRYGFKSGKAILRIMASSIIRRLDFRNAILSLKIWLNSKTVLQPSDPANTFNWIMDTSEKYGIKSAFYFICGNTVPGMDADYQPEHPAIRSLIRFIHKRGHEIGLHPSYGTFQNPALIKKEADSLRKIAAEEGISQNEWGGRMHYLRWEHPATLRALDECKLTYDCTLGYADQAGFRCGTCFEYPAFDHVQGKLLSIRIRPLIVMEDTIMASQYLGLGTSQAAFEKFKKLKEICQIMNGCFTLLWHNCHLEKSEERALYESILK